MTDPARLLAGEATDFERLLLESAAQETPSRDISSMMLAGVTGAAVGGNLGGADLAGGAAQALPKTGAVLWKWVASAVGIGAVGSGVWLWADSGPSRDAPPMVSVPTEPSAAVELTPPPEQPAVVPQQAVDDAPTAPENSAEHSTRTPPKPRAATDALRAELRMLDEARGALTRGKATQALVILERYERRFPRGTLKQEATVLKVKALEAGGRDQEAASLKEDFRRKHPDSAHSKRLERKR